MSDVVTFLDEMIFSGQLRNDRADGYTCCRLEYNNGVLSLRKGEREQRSIAAFYIPETMQVNLVHETIITEPMQCYIIERMLDTKQINSQTAITFSMLCSIACCTTIFQNPDSGLLMQKLFFWNNVFFWNKSWIHNVLRDAEERVCRWIYGG